MKKWNAVLTILLLWGLFVSNAHASVVFNEIAWMGGVISSTDEWIELANDANTPVDLSGWQILASDGSPSITLSGIIAAGGYFLIERTDDDTVPGVSADMIAVFGNGLSNGGETLSLNNTSGVTVDTLSGGSDWLNIGGDNTTKQTAQKTTNSWVTGEPTPRAQNIAQGGEVAGASIVDTEAATTTTSSNAVSGSVSKPSLYPRTTIVVEVGSDMRGFSGFPVYFKGSSTGLFNEPLERATYRWNFGDGNISDQQNPTHVYDIAGEYVVTLEVFWSHYHERDRLFVSITSPEIVVSEFVGGQSGYVRLLNRSSSEIDLSSWVLRASSGYQFVFPANSIILPKKSFTLSHKTSGLIHAASTLVLTFPDGREAAVWGAREVIEIQSAPPVRATTPSVRDTPVPTVLPNSLPSTAALALVTASPSTTVLWEKSASVEKSHNSPSEIFMGEGWLFALLATLLAGLAGFIIWQSRANETTIEDEYAIIEDIIEGKDE